MKNKISTIHDKHDEPRWRTPAFQAAYVHGPDHLSLLCQRVPLYRLLREPGASTMAEKNKKTVTASSSPRSGSIKDVMARRSQDERGLSWPLEDAKVCRSQSSSNLTANLPLPQLTCYPSGLAMPPPHPLIHGWNTGCLSAGAWHKTHNAPVVAPWIQTSINGSPGIVCHSPLPRCIQPRCVLLFAKDEAVCLPAQSLKASLSHKKKKNCQAELFSKRHSVPKQEQPGKKNC